MASSPDRVRILPAFHRVARFWHQYRQKVYRSPLHPAGECARAIRNITLDQALESQFHLFSSLLVFIFFRLHALT